MRASIRAGGWATSWPSRSASSISCGTARDIEARVAQLLNLVGLARNDARRYPHEFSGGQRQRISIARALATEAHFLVCDEPTSALDVSVQAQILNLMRALQAELRLTYLFISHNMAVVRHMSDEIAVMYLGRIVEQAPAEQLFAAARHPYTRLLLETIPDLEAPNRNRVPLAGEVPNPIEPPSGCAFHPRCLRAEARCRAEAPSLREIARRASPVTSQRNGAPAEPHPEERSAKHASRL